MPPDFNKVTKDILAKRAAFKCSNPDCRVSTVGPNVDSNKATPIGEAAHIFGARPNSKRYRSDMTDATRAEITNAIWLCRNCHKLIDSDDKKYTSNILFAWREEHEEYIQSKLGTITERIEFEDVNLLLSKFENLSRISRRIIIDKPDGWEYRLTAELMRNLNQPLLRKIEDLHDGLYVKPYQNIPDEKVLDWVMIQLDELSGLTSPLIKLLEKLNQSWGKPGEAGSEEEIYHITHLIRDYLEQVVYREEQLHFVHVSDDYKRLIDLLKNLIGSEVLKLANVPKTLDKVVSLIGTNHGGTIENPLIIEEKITFNVPPKWERKFKRELRRIKWKTQYPQANGCSSGCATLFIIIIIVFLISLF